MNLITSSTSTWPTTTRHNDQSILNRLDLISVAVLGIVIAICTMVCCFVGLRRRKVLPNESQTVDVHPNENQNTSDTFGVELRNPVGIGVQSRHGELRNVVGIGAQSRVGELRAPDSPPPTYSILERQMSFTSQISQSSSQIEVPPNYEEAAGHGRQSLMSTLIPEEGEGGSMSTKMVAKGRSYQRSESAQPEPPARPLRTHRSKSDIGRSRRRRTPLESERAQVTFADAMAARPGDTSSLPPGLSGRNDFVVESSEPLLSPNRLENLPEEIANPPDVIFPSNPIAPTNGSKQKILNRLSTEV